MTTENDLKDDIQIKDYIDPATFEQIKALADGKETPFIVVDTATVGRKCDELRNNFPYADIYYAVKANPAPEVLKVLRDKGCNFDVASIYELEILLALGVSADRISFGNTIKKARDVRTFYEKGVRIFATDSEADLRNIAAQAPGSRIFVRILTEGSQTADWPLSRKFGCQSDMAIDLLVMARDLGLDPYGLSFHVGSQQRDIGAWDAALAKVKVIFERMKDEYDIPLKMINMGGGLPANYLATTNDLATYGQEITRFIQEDFGEDFPQIILEPGRSVVSDAGVLVTEIVLISRKSSTALNRWVYTDVGKFSGLIETLDEAIKFPIYSERQGKTGPVVIAGPTCDSADVMYENAKYSLPEDLQIGDRLYWFSTGGYTVTYAAQGFNGFPPLREYYI